MVFQVAHFTDTLSLEAVLMGHQCEADGHCRRELVIIMHPGSKGLGFFLFFFFSFSFLLFLPFPNGNNHWR